MNHDQLQSEQAYAASTAIIKRMVDQGILTEQEQRKLDTIMRKKYASILGSLAR